MGRHSAAPNPNNQPAQQTKDQKSGTSDQGTGKRDKNKGSGSNGNTTDEGNTK